ncbi:hypothetical protein VTL71DRAFT_2739 [Oculimacula yallundae]|uniref:Xylanolytic transcriptional activator regulatory domain-containing protein n=1 Tax=Oculimacula yallundae TaxID=86028 RepID=A0ABR4C9P2_9HELO
MEGKEPNGGALTDLIPSIEKVSTVNIGSTGLQDFNNGPWIDTPSLASEAQIEQTTPQQSNLLGSDGQALPKDMFVVPSGNAESYGMPAAVAQPPNPLSQDLGYQFRNNEFDNNVSAYPSVTAYDFALLSNQSMELPETGDYGYSAINWLSPKDLGYSEFDYQSQYFDVDDFSFWAASNNQNVPEQQVSVEEDNSTSQNIGEVDSHVQNAANSAQEAQTVASVQTPDLDSPITCSTPSKSSNYYIDGAGAREPRYGRLRRQRIGWEGTEGTQLSALDPLVGNGFGMETCFPSSIEVYLENNDIHSPHGLSQDIYKTLIDEFRRHGLGNYYPSESDYFPSVGIFNLAKQLYFEYFHPIFPLLHRGSITGDQKSWLVELALATIGVNYLGTKVSQQCSEAFVVFLIRCLDNSQTFGSSYFDDARSDLQTGLLFEIQARVLCCVAMYHSRNPNIAEKSLSMRSQLVGYCLRFKLLSAVRTPSSNLNQQINYTWQEFIFKESRIRTGYCIFLLDCLVAYQSDCRPQMQLEDAKAPLPCCEDVWEACDELSWQRASSPRPVEGPSLLAALESLYKNKSVHPYISEFGRILLIHGLYHRTWEVARYHKDTLSNWIPSVPGTRAPSPSAADPVIEWLPRNPVFSKWRNSACDCLDVLHWSANSQIAQRAGLEHPTILHLHLARLILLTPAPTIQSLASLILQNAKSNAAPQESSQAQYHEDRSEVLRWFIQDQYKARLALVHAGAIFWHVRRYSHDSMLEPFAVLLATLVVWAYATSSQAIDQQQRQGLNNTENSGQDQGHPHSSHSRRSDKEPENDLADLPFINLDRLCDDELIQMYVLHGSRMKGYMAGIGDICKEGALVKILREGSKIIACNGTHRGHFLQSGGEHGVTAALPTWGIGVRHALFLKELADVSQRRLE